MELPETLRHLPLTFEKEAWRLNHPTKKLLDGKTPVFTFCNDWVIRWRGGIVLGQAPSREAAILDAEQNLQEPFWRQLVVNECGQANENSTIKSNS